MSFRNGVHQTVLQTGNVNLNTNNTNADKPAKENPSTWARPGLVHKVKKQEQEQEQVIRTRDARQQDGRSGRSHELPDPENQKTQDKDDNKDLAAAKDAIRRLAALAQEAQANALAPGDRYLTPWLEMSNVRGVRASPVTSDVTSESIKQQLSSCLAELTLDDTPCAYLYAGGKPWADDWAWYFTRGCKAMSDGLPLGNLQCRYLRVQKESCRLEKFLAHGDRGLWHLSSVIVSYAQEDPRGLASETLRGGIMYHYHVDLDVDPASLPGRFLSGELTCAMGIITYQIQKTKWYRGLMKSRSASSAVNNDVPPEEYSARIVSFTDTYLRVLVFRYNMVLDEVTFEVLFSCPLFVKEEGIGKLNQDWANAILWALGQRRAD